MGWAEAMKYIPILLISTALIFGGVVDYNRREIPNAVPIILLIVGCFFGFSLSSSIIGLAVPALLLFMTAKLTKSDVPGGDFKLLCSLGFACGLSELSIVILLAGIGAVLCGFARHLPVKRHIPLCSYIAPAYIACQIIAFVIELR